MTTIYVRGKRTSVRTAIAAAVAAATGRGPDPTGAARELQLLAGMVALSLIKDNFITLSDGGTGVDGTRWAPLAESTKRKRRKGPGKGEPQILRDTGLLLNSLSPGVSGPGQAVQILRTEPGAVIVGTNRKGAKWHMVGGKHLPKRRLWPEVGRWPDAWWRQIVSTTRQGAIKLISRTLGA